MILSKLRAAALTAVVVAGGASVWLLGLGADGPIDAAATTTAGPAAPPLVDVRTVEVGRLATYVEATANLEAERRVTVSAESQGRVTAVLVDEGDEVDSGRLLVRVGATQVKMAAKTARLRAHGARRNAERASTLSSRALIPAEELDKLTLERDVAAQELAEAKRKITKTRAVAPFAGRITKRHVTLGQYVSAGERLFDLADFDPLVAHVHVPERDAVHLEVGRVAKMALHAQPSITFEGHVQKISPVVDPTTGTVKLTIEVARAPAGVRPGSFVTMTLVRTDKDDARLVPTTAVVRTGDEPHVFVVADGVAERRTVTLGAQAKGRQQITHGLEPSERVIVAGHGAVKEGTEVTVREDEG